MPFAVRKDHSFIDVRILNGGMVLLAGSSMHDISAPAAQFAQPAQHNVMRSTSQDDSFASVRKKYVSVGPAQRCDVCIQCSYRCKIAADLMIEDHV